MVKLSVDANLPLPDLEFVSAGYEERPSDFDLSAPTRGYAVIHVVLSGSGHVFYGDRHLTVGKGWCFLIREWERALYYADPKDPWVYCWISFRGTDCESVIRRLGFVSGPVTPVARPLAIRDVIMRMMQDRLIGASRELRLQGMFLEVLSLIGEGTKTDPVSAGDSGNVLIHEAITYIDGHLADPVTVQALADHLFISREYLFKLFRKHCGVTPSAFIARARLSQAQEYLGRDVDRPIADIAEACGYSSAYAMSKAFSRHVKMTPSQWRQRFRSA